MCILISRFPKRVILEPTMRLAVERLDSLAELLSACWCHPAIGRPPDSSKASKMPMRENVHSSSHGTRHLDSTFPKK